MRWPAWFVLRRRASDIDEEIRTHLEMATHDRIERGMSPDEAGAAARREFGNVPLVAQTTREVWSWTALEHVLQDLRFGARILWHAPGLSATAVLLVALVIGGNTTIYSMINGLLVSPAQGVAAERLVAIKHAEPGVLIADPFISVPNYEDYARLSTTLQSLTGWSSERLTLGTQTGTYAVFGGLVTANYFETLGVTFAHGRALQADDDQAREGVVAVISDRVWRERFGYAPDVIGRPFRINNAPATVVGVTAPGFAGALLTPGEDVWVPIQAYYRASGHADVLTNRGQPLVAMVGQRRPTASLTAVRAEFDTLTSQLYAAFPEAFTTVAPRGVVTMSDPRAAVSPYSAAALLPLADMAPRFLAFFSIVTVLTLVVVAANVANLLLGRAVERQRDTAVRQSLGASRHRIIRMLVAEGAALAFTAWAAACLLAWWTSRALLQFVEPVTGLLAGVRPDWTVLAYAMVLAAVATLAFTTAPAIRTWRLPVLPLLKSGEQGVARGRSRLSTTLVVVQLAFSVLLLTSAGLAYRSLSMLDPGHVGFDADHLLLVTVRAGSQEGVVTSAPSAQDQQATLVRLEQVRSRLAEEGRVVAVSYARRVPGPTALSTTPVRTPYGEPVQTFVRPVGPDYLRVLGLRPVAGRELTARDSPDAPPTAVINRRLAEELFAGRSPIGQVLHIGERRRSVEVVGVAPDALFDGPVHDPHPRYVFIAQQQVTDRIFIDPTFLIRHEGTLEAVTPIVTRAIADVDPTLPIVSLSTMRTRLAQVTELQAQITTLVIAFAFASLLVAALGQYAVAMFNMRRRTRDFGVRIALGASPRTVQRAVIREALGQTLKGLLMGFALSATIAVLFRAALFGVTPLDPPAYGAVLLLMATTSLLASYVPAWRAGRVNVIETLRSE